MLLSAGYHAEKKVELDAYMDLVWCEGAMELSIGRVLSNRYRDFPRMVGETSGKNFHLVHRSADNENAARHTIRASFEYSGQNPRLVPGSTHHRVRPPLSSTR